MTLIYSNAKIEFQYNTCLGSTVLLALCDFANDEFQYNTCLGSTVSKTKVGKAYTVRFQYNTCLGSTNY